ncbi:MAG: hypothetical protein O2954_14480 [bacterium]|nr:hypothetical protein [bacterium]
MGWVLVALILGAMVYGGMIVVEYTNYIMQARPRLAQLENEALELLGQLNEADGTQEEIENRVVELKPQVAEMYKRVAELRTQLEGEKVRKQRLEMEFFKQRLKGRLRPAIA